MGLFDKIKSGLRKTREVFSGRMDELVENYQELDDANIDTYADYLKSYSENTQFIVITHRKGTMERCDALYGVVMEEKGISKTVSVKLNEAS